MDKKLLRPQAKAHRDSLVRSVGNPEFWHTYAERLLIFILDLAEGEEIETIAAYWPLPGELDVRPFIDLAHDAGYTLALPLAAKAGEALSFGVYAPGDELIPGPYGVMSPSSAALVTVPQMILVPLICFNSDNYRLGYGGGFYDRTLAVNHHPIGVGIALEGMQVEFTPEPHDVPMEAMFVGLEDD